MSIAIILSNKHRHAADTILNHSLANKNHLLDGNAEFVQVTNQDSKLNGREATL
jgi:hypothetical protein